MMRDMGTIVQNDIRRTNFVDDGAEKLWIGLGTNPNLIGECHATRAFRIYVDSANGGIHTEIPSPQVQ